LNAHISEQVIAVIGSPFATRSTSSPYFFDFYGSRNFQALHGCVFTRLTESYNVDSSSSGSASGYDWQANLKYDSQSPSITSLSASDESLDIEFEDCTASGGHKKGRVVKRYRHTSSSFPNGVEVKFFYDALCRVRSLEEHQPESSEESAEWAMTYSSNFTYSTDSDIQPFQIKSRSAIAVTLVENDFQVNANGLITQLTSTQRTAQLNSDVFVAEPITETWDFSYDPQTSSRLEHAHVHREDIREDVDEFFHFHYDRSGRWSSVLSSSRQGDEEVNSATITTMKAVYRERMVDVLMNVGVTYRMRGIKA